MDISSKLKVIIDFDKYLDIKVISVFDGVEIETKTFSKSTHFIETIFHYIKSMELGGCDVYC